MAQTAILSLRLQTSAALLASQSSTVFGADSALRRPAGSVAQRHTSVTVRAQQKRESNSNAAAARTANAASLSLAAIASIPAPAMAVDTQAVTSVLSQVEDISAQLSEKASITYETAKGIAEQVISVTKPAIDAATPVLKDAAVKAYEFAAPVASEGFQRAQKALSEAGVDTTPVIEAAKTAASVAGEVSQQTQGVFTQVTPGASSTLESILALDPAILAGASGGVFLLYLAAPSIGAAIAYSARGYAGELTAAQTLDLLARSDYTLVDVRSEREKAKSGLPSLPRNAKKKVFTIGVEELPSKLRGQLRDSRRVEAELAAIKIASLKKLNKSSNVAIIDSYGPTAKNVARSLTKLGFKRAFVVKDGIDGGSGWLNSQLATDPYYSSDSQVLSPSRVIPAAVRAFGTRGGTTDIVDMQPSRRGFLLPGGAEE